MAQTEKRYAKRAYGPIEIEILEDGKVAAATIENISASGAFIDSGSPLESGTLVHFRAPLPDAPQARPIEGNARVIWHAPHGAGVEFQDLNEEDRKRLKLFVDSHSVRPRKKRKVAARNRRSAGAEPDPPSGDEEE